MISGPDAGRIGRALESVKGWTAELIVVVNDDVTDGTDKIAEKLGAKVFREPWKEHIAQKNSAAAKASQPWILGLDSDEEISSRLRESITRFMLSVQVNAPDAFRMARCSLFLGHWVRHGDWYPDWQPRLWPGAPCSLATGFGMATGIPIGRRAYGKSAKPSGAESILTTDWRWMVGSAR